MRHNGPVSVVVLGDEVVNTAGQSYSLVITGVFEEVTTCPSVPECPLCLNGECEDGECVCADGWEGPSCGVQVRGGVINRVERLTGAINRL